MARNKIGLKFEGWEDYIAKLDEIGGGKAMERGVEAALKVSKQYVNPEIEKAMAKGNLPAGGKYSKGGTKQSIDKDMTVYWEGYTGEIKIGFDFSKSGLKSIFLMYGTPRMAPVKGLKAAIYGAKTNRHVKEIQEEAISKVIKRIMEG